MKYSVVSKKMIPFALGLSLLGGVVSCGSDDDDDDNNVVVPQLQEEQGFFRATLTPLNASVAGNTSGTAEFRLDGDSFKAKLRVNGAPVALHAQHIHAAAACPTIDADTNKDGFIDVVEGLPAYGPILVPLDGDLSSQDAGGTEFPSGRSYEYEEETSYAAMLADLKLPDPNTEDAVTKLGASELLELEGRHVIIHGVVESADLPETVATIADLPRYVTLPIACGKIEKASEETDNSGSSGDSSGDDDSSSDDSSSDDSSSDDSSSDDS
jgi:hypothetical protein